MSYFSAAIFFLLYLTIILFPAGIAFLNIPAEEFTLLDFLARTSGLTGFTILALQAVSSARFPILERTFGLDRLLLFHKQTAILGCTLLIAHPILLSLSWESTWLLSNETDWTINIGKIGLFFLLLTILLVPIFRKMHVDYRIWRHAHRFTALGIIPFGLLHGISTGSDLDSPFKKALFCAAPLLFLLSVLYRNLYVPLIGRRRFVVKDITRETHNTWTLTLSPVPGAMFPYLPGQFMFLRLVRKGFHTEEHPFTISSTPTQPDNIKATIKESGDYTRTIGKTRPGDTAFVEGPFGRFSLCPKNPQSLLFIAGGVGITPIMSMLRYMRNNEDTRPASLLYANRGENDIIFRNEIGKLPSSMKVAHVLSEAGPDWQEDRGYVTAELIKRHAGEMLEHCHVYLCGPPPMMKQVLRILKTIKVPKKRIHYERFSL